MAVKRKAKSTNVDVVICPPFVYLPVLKGATLGAQDMFWEEKGAYTGEISALQLVDLNVEYVIIGHSERRKYFNETNEIVNKKIHKALEVGLKVIFCVGEHEGEDKAVILEKQLTQGLSEISNSTLEASNLVIAYEPVWAIGTGKNCSVQETEDAVGIIRSVIMRLYGDQLAKQIAILYGGSVTSQNSLSYLASDTINGFLVGGASLNADEFINIVKSAE